MSDFDPSGQFATRSRKARAEWELQKRPPALWAIPFFNDDPPGSLRPRLETLNAAAFKTAMAMEPERSAPYRVTILPTVLEVSARLATSEELRGLVKLLRASAVIWGKTEPNEDCERPSYEVPEEDLLTLRDIWRRLDSTASKPFPR